MNSNEQDTRQVIISTTKILLDETPDINKITVRQIAERAGVGLGLINYHFQSKENLLSSVIGDVMSKTISEYTLNDTFSNLLPIDKLKEMMKALYNIADRHEKLLRFILLHEITNENMQTPLYIIPLLKEIFGDQKDDMQLRIIALQILYPIQVTGIKQKAFSLYSGIDLTNIKQRDYFVDSLVDNLINNAKIGGTMK